MAPIAAAVAIRPRTDCSSMEGHTSLSTALVYSTVSSSVADPFIPTATRLNWKAVRVDEGTVQRQFVHIIHHCLE